MKLAVWSRALRLPFLTVSVLPYLYGALVAPGGVRFAPVLLGLLAVAAAHLAANLANDYGDAMSGADNRDPEHYGFFGGAKLLQEGVLCPAFYRAAVPIFAAIALMAGLAAVALAGTLWLVGLLVASVLLGVAYTLPPLRLGYRRLGEAAVFLLFGPVCVAAGAGLQGASLATPAIWLQSLPFGFLAASVLAANEVPDAETDALAGKETLVTAVGPRHGHLLYLALVGLAVAAAGGCVALGLLPWAALGVVAAVPFAWRAARILRIHYGEKRVLLASSRLAAALHTAAGMVLLLAAGQ